jgi:diaminopimelate epimerase
VRVVKYQALGNDYLITEERPAGRDPDPGMIRRLCDRHYGVGSDGLIVRQPMESEPTEDGAQASDVPGQPDSEQPPDTPQTFSIHIYNPDGSWAEKSGNGLRIFARYLWDREEVTGEPFRVRTPGGMVTCRILDGGERISIQMGRAVFDSRKIPATGPRREILRESLQAAGETLTVSAVSMGNPHCVVHREQVSEGEARRLGPHIENHPLFPRRTNVQFMQVIDRGNIRIEIWERGAGYTLASGTSSCAVCAVARQLDLCDNLVTVHMPGGELIVEIGADFQMGMTGPAGEVFEAEYRSSFREERN